MLVNGKSTEKWQPVQTRPVSLDGAAVLAEDAAMNIPPLPQLPLGIRVMDEDHYALEQMFSRTPEIADESLRPHLDAIIAAIAAHFAREEAEMERLRVPVLPCHRGQHAALLAEAEKLRERFVAAEPAMRRHLVGYVLAQLVANHIATLDRIASEHFEEKIDYSQMTPA
jgi:hemerythrin-like metal-binding protein